MASLFDELNRLHAAGQSVADHEDALFEQFGRTLSVLVADTVGMTKATQQRGIIHFLGKVAHARTSPAHFRATWRFRCTLYGRQFYRYVSSTS